MTGRLPIISIHPHTQKSRSEQNGIYWPDLLTNEDFKRWRECIYARSNLSEAKRLQTTRPRTSNHGCQRPPSCLWLRRRLLQQTQPRRHHRKGIGHDARPRPRKFSEGL